jgi:ElaB/YqjD/DUF883 family membrane-anchored ribosome-binding protein
MASQHQAHSRKREAEHNGEAGFREHGSDLLHDTIEEFRERSEDIRTLVSEYVREKPVKALGISLLVGMALALFMKR